MQMPAQLRTSTSSPHLAAKLVTFSEASASETKAPLSNNAISAPKINYKNISVSLFVNFQWPWDASAFFALALPHAFSLVFLVSV